MWVGWSFHRVTWHWACAWVFPWSDVSFCPYHSEGTSCDLWVAGKPWLVIFRPVRRCPPWSLGCCPWATSRLQRLVGASVCLLLGRNLQGTPTACVLLRWLGSDSQPLPEGLPQPPFGASAWVSHFLSLCTSISHLITWTTLWIERWNKCLITSL